MPQRLPYGVKEFFYEHYEKGSKTPEVIKDYKRRGFPKRHWGTVSNNYNKFRRDMKNELMEWHRHRKTVNIIRRIKTDLSLLEDKLLEEYPDLYK
jgi:hypothetical protein